MTDAASETALEALAAHAARKAELQRPLIEALTTTPAYAGTSARERLEQLLTPETLADLDERVLALVTEENENETEPKVPFLDAVAAAQEAQRRALVDAVTGRSARAPAEATGSLDGGARQTPAKPQTHEQTLIAVLRSGRANVGANL
jgi:hypothetical protein